MGLEIERRFLVASSGWCADCVKTISIRQGYIPSASDTTVRVRVAGDQGYVTVKRRLSDLVREEFETAVPVGTAERLLRTRCTGTIVEKVRHEVFFSGVLWEIDVFAGTNSGLVLAEVELEDPEQNVDLPDWVGCEVTADRRYSNSRLAHRPFCLWGSSTDMMIEPSLLPATRNAAVA